MDADVINQTFDLLPVVERDTSLTRTSGWHYGPCPFCGGTDRFLVHQKSDGWKWFCRGCGDGYYHSVIDYFMRREELDFTETIKYLEGDIGNEVGNRRKRAEPQKHEKVTKPSRAWRERGLEYVQECTKYLWEEKGGKALDWIRKRGLNDYTIRKYGLGYNPEDWHDSAELWGFGGDRDVYLARGITMPCFGPDGLYYIKTRRPVRSGATGKKYIKVRGSKTGVYGWQNMLGAYLAVICEGEFDAMILDQEAKDIANVCTFGSATDSPMNIDHSMLRWHISATHTLAVYDNDEQGRDGAMSLQERWPKVRIASLPSNYKDINDFFLAGGDLADWLCREVERLGLEVKEL